jgi:hypothetical protein
MRCPDRSPKYDTSDSNPEVPMRLDALAGTRQHENTGQIASGANKDGNKQKQPVVLLSDTRHESDHPDLRPAPFHAELTLGLGKLVKF